MSTILRKTSNYTAAESRSGVRITANASHYPRSRVVRRVEDFDKYLKGLPDKEFDGACLLDFGVGVFASRS